jgi:hypothetical protein
MERRGISFLPEVPVPFRHLQPQSALNLANWRWSDRLKFLLYMLYRMGLKLGERQGTYLVKSHDFSPFKTHLEWMNGIRLKATLVLYICGV